jgi:hypothetical protein
MRKLLLNNGDRKGSLHCLSDFAYCIGSGFIESKISVSDDEHADAEEEME